MRSALFACAALSAALAVSPASAEPAQCAPMQFRIYFEPQSAALDPAAHQMLRLAERNVAGCDYAELSVRVDEATPQAEARGRAILAAADAKVWDEVRIEPATAADAGAGPAFADVAATPYYRAPAASTPGRRGEAGV